jgi:hypothetical protein
MVFGKAYFRVTTIQYYQGQIMIMSYSSEKLREGIGELQDYVHGIAIL